MIITITESAKNHIVNVLTDLDKPYLLFGLKGGGCAGFEYFWEPADTVVSPKDEAIDLVNQKKLIIDSNSLLYLFGSTIDYKSDFLSSSLIVNNPNAKSSCGCNKSISV